MGQRAADRAPVAHLRVGDRAGRTGEDPKLGRVLELCVRGQRPDPPVAVLALDPVQAGDLAQVDEQRRRRQPQLHQRDQRVPAGQRLGVLAAVGERPDRLVERVRGGVVELCRDHAAPPSGLAPLASEIASHTRIGLSGMLM